MFKRAGSSLKPHLRKLHPRGFSSTQVARQRIQLYPGVIASTGIAAAYILWYTNTRGIHNDSLDTAPSIELVKSTQLSLPPGGDVGESDDLHAVVWGSNKSNTLTSDAIDVIRTPSIARWLDGVALRDFALHRDHAACVDARGDVYQWGDGFEGPIPEEFQKPRLTLKGKDIIQLRLTEGRLYALSSSGKVYALSASAENQKLQPGSPTPSSDSWWGTGWLWGEDQTIDFVELTPDVHLSRGEKLTSIDAGNDHLLAVTSKGRVFAHPVNKKANAYGQLGLRKFKVPDPSIPHHSATKSPLEVELIPKSIADPYAKSSRGSRPSQPLTMSENLVDIDDKNIRFCPYLFEVPILRGVDIAQVTAGSRSSFARTKTGRVLGWGANEYGQIGLGGNIALDTITVPTEVILWKSAPLGTKTTCLDVSAGGDLTAFTVERTGESNSRTIDILMCGNGQWGGLGGNSFSNAQGSPLRAKNVSGLMEYSDLTRRLEPIGPANITVSPTGHILLTLDTGSEGNGGRDLVVWGKNHESELGNGKKSSVPVPTTLETPEGGRFMLRRRKAKEVLDLKGQVWGRRIEVEQRAVVGFGSSAVYWKIT